MRKMENLHASAARGLLDAEGFEKAELALAGYRRDRAGQALLIDLAE